MSSTQAHPSPSATEILLITVACLIFLAAAIYALSYLFRTILANRYDSQNGFASAETAKAKTILEAQIQAASGLDRLELLDVLQELEQGRGRGEMVEVRRGPEDVEAGDLGLARGPSTPLTDWNVPWKLEAAQLGGMEDLAASTLPSLVGLPFSWQALVYADGTHYPSSTALPSALRRSCSRHTVPRSTHTEECNNKSTGDLSLSSNGPSNRSTGDLSFSSIEPSLEPECHGWRKSTPSYEQWHRELALETLEGRVPWYESDHQKEYSKLDERTPSDIRRLAGKKSVSEQKRDWLQGQLKGVGEVRQGRSSLMSAVLRAGDVADE